MAVAIPTSLISKKPFTYRRNNVTGAGRRGYMDRTNKKLYDADPSADRAERSQNKQNSRGRRAVGKTPLSSMRW